MDGFYPQDVWKWGVEETILDLVGLGLNQCEVVRLAFLLHLLKQVSMECSVQDYVLKSVGLVSNPTNYCSGSFDL